MSSNVTSATFTGIDVDLTFHVYQIVIAVVVALFPPVLFLETWQLWVVRRTVDVRKPESRWRLPLALNTAWIVIDSTTSLTAAVYVYDADNAYDVRLCDGLSKLSMVTIFLIKMFGYGFLYDRACIVSNALKLNSRASRVVRWVAFLVIYVCVPLGAFINAGITVSGELVGEPAMCFVIIRSSSASS